MGPGCQLRYPKGMLGGKRRGSRVRFWGYHDVKHDWGSCVACRVLCRAGYSGGRLRECESPCRRACNGDSPVGQVCGGRGLRVAYGKWGNAGHRVIQNGGDDGGCGVCYLDCLVRRRLVAGCVSCIPLNHRGAHRKVRLYGTCRRGYRPGGVGGYGNVPGDVAVVRDCGQL